MTKKRKAARRPQAGVRELRDRLKTAEETLRAIRAGEVDAIVRGRARGAHVITLVSAELAYTIPFAPVQREGSGDVIGVIGVVTDISERERAEELRNRLIQQAVTAQEEERRRIARELHDEAGQSLTALLVGLRTIEESRTITEA